MATPVASPRDVQLTATAPDSSQAAPKNALWPFIIITITYLLFTVTDGAVRMLVLLHAYTKGFTAMEVSVMFALYELCGAGTNLAAGVVGAKWGIRVTLIAGLLMQIVGLSALYAWNDKWSKLDAIVYVTFASSTSSTPCPAQSTAPGVLSLEYEMRRTVPVSAEVTSSDPSTNAHPCRQVPWIESYFARYAHESPDPGLSLMCTNSSSGWSYASLNARRPMRPKPFMPTLTIARAVVCGCGVD